MQNEPEPTKTNRSGCIIIIIILAIAGYASENFLGIKVETSDFTGTWNAKGSDYNPYSLGGIIEKGYYPVEYRLEITGDGSYKLYYGSPGFLKLERQGHLKNTKSGLTLVGFDLSNAADHEILETKVHDKQVFTFCTRAVASVIEGCHIKFHR